MNASSSMHSRLAVRQELGSDVGSASITPIDPTRPSAAERPTRPMLGRQTRRNWRPRYANGVIVTQVVPAVDSYASAILKYKTALAKYFPGVLPHYVSLEGYVAG